MRFATDAVRVRVPATSANLGPGFDALGMALGLYDEIEVRALGTAGARVEVLGEGAGTLPEGEDHLVVRALRHALDVAGAPQVGLEMRCTNRIPHCRGLGSSAAAVVAGVVAARGLVAEAEALDDGVALRIATEFEGHPDNAAPAILGGATIAWTEDDGPRAVTIDVDPGVVPIAIVPPVQLSTRTARGVLPAHVPHGDAAFVAGRAALLVEALGRRPELLLPATEDRLHQHYRGSVMPDSLALVTALRSRGVAAVVSGAGPTVLALARKVPGGTDADAVIAEVFGPTMGGWRVRTLGVAPHGAQVERTGAPAR